METVTRSELERAATLRTELRRFLARTSVAASEAGLTPQRYDLLLMIEASPERRLTVTELCDALQLRQTAVTELVKRARESGLVTREQSTRDARVSYVKLTPEGERRLFRVFQSLSEDRASFLRSLRLLRQHVQAAG